MKDLRAYEAMQRAVAAGAAEGEALDAMAPAMPLWWDDASYIRYQSEDRFAEGA